MVRLAPNIKRGTLNLSDTFKKNPAVAAAISLVPGLGQLYVGRKKKAAALFCIDAGIILSGTGSSTTIGGTTGTTPGGACAGACNVISGNVHGIFISTPTIIGDLVQGNYIGTDVTGLVAMGNALYGINLLDGTSGNMIGGMTASARNVISSNFFGVNIEGASTNNIVQGNYIGVNAAGTGALGNIDAGVRISGSSNNTIGVNAAGTGAGNVLSGSTQNAEVFITGGTSTGNVVAGNYIGTNAAGTTGLANSSKGVGYQFAERDCPFRRRNPTPFFLAANIAPCKRSTITN